VASKPFLTDRVSIKWDGEWQVTYEVFRDLGIAFAAVMVPIYILVVGWFRSFRAPLVIMAPIPLAVPVLYYMAERGRESRRTTLCAPGSKC
jgi:multidrug efflux pump subunit AcrB